MKLTFLASNQCDFGFDIKGEFCDSHRWNSTNEILHLETHINVILILIKGDILRLTSMASNQCDFGFSIRGKCCDQCNLGFSIRGNFATHIVGKPGGLNPLQWLDVCVASPEALKHFDDDDISC